MSAIEDIQSDESRLEMTPMIDVTFLLLIFFLSTIRFKSLEGKLAAYLPKGNGPGISEAPPIDAMLLTIRVTSPGLKVLESDPSQIWRGTGTFTLQGHEVEYQLGRKSYPGTAIGHDSLTIDLMAQVKASPERPLKINALPGTLHLDAVAILDICHAAGLEDVVFSGSRR